MEQSKIEIKILNDLKSPPNAQIIENAIYVEDEQNAIVSEVTVSGKFNRKYTVIGYLVELNQDRVLIDDNLLIVCLWSNLAIIDMKQNKLLKSMTLCDMGELFGVYKFKSGYFIYGELENFFINEHFEVVWEMGCIDIFVNPKAEKELEIFDDYISVYDWYGYKHFYNESGEFKEEYYPEYDYR